MISIANPRAEKAARRLAKKLDTTISEAVAVACEKLLDEKKAAARAKRRLANLDRVLAETRKRFPLQGTPEERARLADHSDLYDEFGLPK
ncbi:MAG TPA: type II toxin-antitoxin system VapB family antitoxin [Reyranella sp.]|nr:type II toxin-antitoxin system VapB family antitoxin [Reyranella sp.]